MDQETKKRAVNQRGRILEALRQAGINGITNIELSKIALRFQSRLHELYVQGYGVKTTTYDGGLTHYLLLWEPIFPLDEQPKALEVLVFEINRTYGGAIRSDQLVRLLQEKRMGVNRRGGSYKQEADFTPKYPEVDEDSPQLSLEL